MLGIRTTNMADDFGLSAFYIVALTTRPSCDNEVNPLLVSVRVNQPKIARCLHEHVLGVTITRYALTSTGTCKMYKTMRILPTRCSLPADFLLPSSHYTILTAATGAYEQGVEAEDQPLPASTYSTADKVRTPLF
ncbi:unnamed protein product [Protopolystoma xenopodis]|uniref:Uncharacterized protein n=1 Tax=Protopolystoma xenopodis TaxID=117903 RepID=A0A448XI09_9PLAT|nr:unnamed protein product [Protopolystoma xenopodis]